MTITNIDVKDFAKRETVFKTSMTRVETWWKSYRRDQLELRRLYLSSPAARHFPIRVWKAHGFLLTEISDRQK